MYTLKRTCRSFIYVAKFVLNLKTNLMFEMLYNLQSTASDPLRYFQNITG